ncbi:MAG: hypothetical protein IPO23_11155 [Flavobacterium sp.]|nr:hypothetical protein [Flavobacterium sp.]
MKKIILTIVLLLSFPTFGQDIKINASLIDTVKIEADSYIGNDSFSAYYFIKNNVFIKKTKSKIYQYKNLSLGAISKVDIQNPLNLVLFYEPFNTVILLDNQLNEIRKINLSEYSTPILATATGLAFGNRLWVYNSLSQQIGLFDFTKSEFMPITTSFEGNMKFYSSNYNYFQWIDGNQNWNSCNIYGQITNLGKIPDFDSLQLISDGDAIAIKEEILYYFSLKENKTTLISIDKKTFKNFYYKDQILSIFTNEGITNYKITIP